MSTDHSHAPYMKIFVWLTVWTILELAIVMEGLGVPRGMAISGLAVMAAIKASLVGLYYMHLIHETKWLRWSVALPMAAPAIYAFVLIAEAGWRLS